MMPRMLIALTLVAAVHCATWVGRQPQKPKELAHKPGCYIQEIQDVIPYGETISLIGSCYSIQCSRHMIYYSSCGTVGTDDPKCYVSDEDLSRPYPACCPDVKCELDNYLNDLN